MSWQDEIRANRAAKAEAARLAETARTGNDIALMKATAEVAREDRELAAKLAAQEKETADAAREKRRGERKALWGKVTRFARSHVVDGLIYGIALTSFVMAAPAMAGYGEDVYRSPLGGLLPLITELGMWAFAIAVLVARVKDASRPVWGYQAGVWVFGTLAFVTNAVHGAARGFDAGLIMGVVSVAGVVAHQLAIATPPRSKAQRAADKLHAAKVAKTHAAARAALKAATAQIDADGNAHLTYTPGTYAVRRGRLVPVAPDLDVPGPPDALDAEIAKLLGSGRTEPEPGPGGGVATDPGPSPDRRPDPARDDTTAGTGPDPSAPRRTVRSTKRSTRSRPAAKPGRDARWERLRTRLAEAIEAGDIDPDTASIYAIAKTLRCGKPAAKRLRAELHNTDQN